MGCGRGLSGSPRIACVLTRVSRFERRLEKLILIKPVAAGLRYGQ